MLNFGGRWGGWRYSGQGPTGTEPQRNPGEPNDANAPGQPGHSTPATPPPAAPQTTGGDDDGAGGGGFFSLAGLIVLGFVGVLIYVSVQMLLGQGNAKTPYINRVAMETVCAEAAPLIAEAEGFADGATIGECSVEVEGLNRWTVSGVASIDGRDRKFKHLVYTSLDRSQWTLAVDEGA
ncbi:MAG: hypothetical protein AAGH45_07720 [Pseudomonadota bacterium]